MPGKFKAAVALLLFAFLLPVPSAQAHSTLISSNPAVNSNLPKLPSQVVVTFDENLLVLGSAKSNILQVSDANGRQIDADNSTVAGPVLRVDIKDRSAVGVFTVSWRVVSGDGHPAEGSFTFSVGLQVNTALPQTSLLPKPAESFWKGHRQEGLLLIALLVFVGIWGWFERKRRVHSRNPRS